MVVRDGGQDAVSIQKVYPIGKSKSHSQYGSNGERGDLSMYNQYIIEEHPERDYYMIIDENNVSSQKGVAKVNFQRFAVGHKDRWGRYVIDQIL